MPASSLRSRMFRPLALRSLAVLVLTASLLALTTSTSALAIEGKWLPEQVPQLDQAMLQKLGLELPAERLWDDKTGTGLLQAAVDLNGCSASFISNTGLVITNHHCVFGIIAEHSTKDKNLLEDGFLARTHAEELRGTTARLRVPVAFQDVTEQVHKAVPADADDETRFKLTDRAKKEIVAACEASPDMRCDISTYYGGLRHVLMVKRELRDVRLVYAPPRAVGEFGGEIDNWMWPRHSGDFAIVRAWAAPPTDPLRDTPALPAVDDDVARHVPFTPAFHFPIAQKGTRAGDFVMVLGYPGYTVREQLAEEMRFRHDDVYPWLIRWGDTLIQSLEAVDDPTGKIAVAPLLKSLHNRTKNARGQLAGIKRGHLIDVKQQADAAVVAYAEKTPRVKDAVVARTMLLEELGERRASMGRDLLLSQVFSGARALSISVKLARMQSEAQKPDLERDPSYMERERPRILSELERDQKSLFVAADKVLLGHFVDAALALPAGQRIAIVDEFFGKAKNPKARAALIDRLYKKTRLLSADGRAPFVGDARTPGASKAALLKSRDPLLQLALGLNDALDQKKRDDDRREGFSLRVRPAWMQAVLAHAGKPVAPDANRSLRVSFATIQGYSPQDGLVTIPYTTLGGMFAKGTGEEPFAIPARVIAAGVKGIGPRFAHPRLGDVPVNFLADADTTGGNSGSPVVNGRGELVGVNFDRVWENVANDFGYNPAIARNVSVDIRYVLWLLHDVDHATELLQELGIRD